VLTPMDVSHTPLLNNDEPDAAYSHFMRRFLLVV
jgi:hypothetical protein